MGTTINLKKATNRNDALKCKSKQMLTGKKGVKVFKFSTKRKWQYFIGNEFEWLAIIS